MLGLDVLFGREDPTHSLGDTNTRALLSAKCFYYQVGPIIICHFIRSFCTNFEK